MGWDNKIELAIELILDVDAMQSNQVNLEKVLSWVKIRDAVVQNMLIGIDAPQTEEADKYIHLPGGFLAKQRPPLKSELGASNRVIYNVSQAGNPFDYVHCERDAYFMVDTLLMHTEPRHTFPDGCPVQEGTDLAKTILQTETYLIQACCLFLYSECPKEDFSLCSIMKLLRSWEEDHVNLTQTSVMDILFDDLRQMDPENPAIAAYHAFKSEVGIRVAEMALASCIHRLENLNLYELSLIMADMQNHSSEGADLNGRQNCPYDHGAISDRTVGKFACTGTGDNH